MYLTVMGMQEKSETQVVIKVHKSENSYNAYIFCNILENSGFSKVTDNTMSLAEISGGLEPSAANDYLWLFLLLVPVDFKEKKNQGM